MAASENLQSSREPSIAESVEMVWTWSKQGRNSEDMGRDGFRLYPDDPLAPIHRELNEYLNQTQNACGPWGIGSINPKIFPAGASFLALPDEKKLIALRAIAVRILFHRRRLEEHLGHKQR